MEEFGMVSLCLTFQQIVNTKIGALVSSHFNFFIHLMSSNFMKNSVLTRSVQNPTKFWGQNPEAVSKENRYEIEE